MPAALSGPVTPTSVTNAQDRSGPNVDYMLPELADQLPKYELIRDCLAGQEAVKARKDKYLPRPNAADESKENRARYDAYLIRALFYNVTANTCAGLVGQVFAAEPTVVFPEQLNPLWDDVSGSGVTMIQQSKRTLSNVLGYGRAGLLVDYPEPKADGTPFTREEVQEGVARPVILFYGATDIINWRTRKIGAVQKLSLVVLNEQYEISDDGFEVKHGNEKRVLRLDAEGMYVVEIWRRRDPTKEDSEWYQYTSYQPKDNAGNRLTYIPFTFVGAQNNDTSVDRPPLYDLACINIAHYRNSADYEDSVYMVGQPTPVFTGLTQDWAENILKGEVQLGSRGAVLLPQDGNADLLQAAENGMVKEAMDKKEQQMIALGAQLVEEKQVQRTLGEAKMEAATVASTLSNAATNVSAAFRQCLVWACDFYGITVTDETLVFMLSTDFAIAKLSPQDRAQLLAEWSAGLISFTEARTQLRQSGVATQDDKLAREEINTDTETRVSLELGVGNGDEGDEE